MAGNVANGVAEYYASVPLGSIEALSTIRHWPQVYIARDEGVFWLKGLSKEDMERSEILSVPLLLQYELKDSFLFRFGHLVPDRKLPTALIWGPVADFMKITLDRWNHHYFCIQEQVPHRLVRSVSEQTPQAILVATSLLGPSIEGVLKIRLAPLKWVMIEDKALVTGTPLLSMPGTIYWSKGSHLLPAGYDFEFPALSLSLENRLNPSRDHWILWDMDGSYTRINKKDFRPLSLSAYRLSITRR